MMTLGLGRAGIGNAETAALPKCAPAGIAKPDGVCFNTNQPRVLARTLSSARLRDGFPGRIVERVLTLPGILR